MASSGNPNDGNDNVPGMLGAPWPQFNASSPSGMNVGDAATIVPLNYTQCDLFNQINSVIVGQDLSGGHGNGGNATQSSTRKGVGTGLRTSSSILFIWIVSAILIS
jgi:hypothetical protein